MHPAADRIKGVQFPLSALMKVYNTLTRKKEEFVPISGKSVGMYVCGPTVYDYSHLGHARSYIAFDIIARYLRFRGYRVKYVQNFTDIDDKIIKRAKETGENHAELAKKFEDAFLEDMDALGVARPTLQVKATDTIPDMIKVIKSLIDKGFAYDSNGNVYFDVSEFPKYGRIARLKKDALQAGARVKPEPGKRSPEDFALWKKSKQGEPFWDSPWGEGRPGWHIECSTMSTKHIGPTLDIHGGGQDLIFPHHTNEIAQSEAYTGKEFAHYWLHNGFVTIKKEKMSKSLGNFFTIRDILKNYDPKTVRFFLISTHYRSPIDFSDEHLDQAKASLARLNTTIYNLLTIKGTLGDNKLVSKRILKYKKQFLDAMDDDFNTTNAIAALFEIAKEANKHTSNKPKRKTIQLALKTIRELDTILNVLSFEKVKPVEREIQELINAREEARKNKHFAAADTIRDELSEKGVILEDTPEGVRWKFAKE